jgi:hypothetical protein
LDTIYVFIRVRKVSHPYKTGDNITVLFSLLRDEIERRHVPDV